MFCVVYFVFTFNRNGFRCLPSKKQNKIKMLKDLFSFQLDRRNVKNGIRERAPTGREKTYRMITITIRIKRIKMWWLKSRRKWIEMSKSQMTKWRTIDIDSSMLYFIEWDYFLSLKNILLWRIQNFNKMLTSYSEALLLCY